MRGIREIVAWARLLGRVCVLVPLLAGIALSGCDQRPAPPGRPGADKGAEAAGTTPSQAAEIELLHRPSFEPATDTPDAAAAVELRDECLALAEQVARSAPQDPAGWNLLAVVHRHFGDTDGAIRIWTHCLTLDDRYAEALIQIGDVALARGDAEEAEKRFRQALAIDPGAIPVVGQLADALLQRGDFAAAADLLETFLAAHPSSSPGWSALGKTRMLQADAAASRTAFERALELDPDSRDAHQGLGKALQSLGDVEGAKAHLATVAKLQGEKVDRYRSGRAQEADAAAPRQWAAATHHDASLLLAVRGDLPGAEKTSLRAIELDENLGPSRELLAAILSRSGRSAEAIAVLRAWCVHAPTSPAAWIALGQMALAQGRGDEAESALRKGVELSPRHGGALALLARVVAPSDASEALALARRSVAAEPTAPNLYVLADMLVRSGDREEALGALERAIKLAPQDRRYQQTYQKLKSQP